jgi:Na+/melibiose symporter-like transporter
LNIVLTLATTVLGELLGGVLPLWFRALSWLMAPLPSWFSWVLASEPEPRSYQLALLLAGIIAAPSFLPLFLMSNDRPALPASVAPESVRDRVPLRQRVRLTLKQWRNEASLPALLASPVVVLTVVQVLIGLGAGLFIPYFNLYFVHYLGASSALFGVIDGGANAFNALLTLLAPLLAARIGKINTITFTRMISVPLLLIIGFSHFLPLVVVLYFLRQGTMDMAAGLFQVFSMEAVSKQHRGLANSVYQVAGQSASAISTPLGGLIIVRTGYPPVFVAAAILYIIAISLLYLRFRHAERRDEPEVEQVESADSINHSDISSPI